MADKGTNIVVGVRVRPMNKKEKKRGDKRAIACVGTNTIREDTDELGNALPKEGKSYSYDHVFDPSVGNEEVYSKIAQPIVSTQKYIL